jgi:deazaflavin-dependent oxidoreductase (nitroreductase family)
MASKSSERLRRVGNTQTMRLTHYGRKTGRPYEVVIWYMLDDGRLYLLSANAERSWVRNVKVRPAISFRIGDEVFSGNVRVITDADEREKVNGLLERKYWFAIPVLRLGRFLASIGIIRDNSAAFEVILADR